MEPSRIWLEEHASLFMAFASMAAMTYLIMVRHLRYKRANGLDDQFRPESRSLSSMTSEEAYDIMTQLQELEFPYAFNKARQIALLKAGAIPTMSKLFAATGQNTRRNAGKRAIDTEILLRESQSQHPSSDRYLQAVARMNYLHARYRKAGKILDADLLHTLGSNVVEMLRIIDQEEWRPLTKAEICAIGIFHKKLGEDMGIPYSFLPSGPAGEDEEGEWKDGVHFAMELRDWTMRHEKEAAHPTPPSDQYVRVYVDSAVDKFPKPVVSFVRKNLGGELDDIMRTALGLETPGPFMAAFIKSMKGIRRIFLRHLCLPRSTPINSVDPSPNPISGLYNFNHSRPQPWYVAPSYWKIFGPLGLFIRLVGGRVPGTFGDKYRPKGYDLWIIGPAPQEGKGIDDMKTNIEFIRARGLSKCPFSQGVSS